MSQGTNYRWVTVVIAGLAAGLIAAVVMPRFGVEGGVQWGVTALVALAVGAAVALSSRQHIDDGAHVRDDTLPPE